MYGMVSGGRGGGRQANPPELPGPVRLGAALTLDPSHPIPYSRFPKLLAALVDPSYPPTFNERLDVTRDDPITPSL
jgi:hypothetical protein